MVSMRSIQKPPECTRCPGGRFAASDRSVPNPASTAHAGSSNRANRQGPGYARMLPHGRPQGPRPSRIIRGDLPRGRRQPHRPMTENVSAPSSTWHLTFLLMRAPGTSRRMFLGANSTHFNCAPSFHCEVSALRPRRCILIAD